MRKTMAILLLFIFSVTQTELGQLLKLPLLIEHYSKHHRQNRTLSFMDFLKDHYTKQHRDKDQQEDRQLPFLSAFPQQSSVAIVPIATLPNRPVLSVCKQFFLLNDKQSLPQAFHSIFHPPQAFIS